MNSIPYGFQPIESESAICDSPLWRDGNSKVTRYTGELLITIKALTPLIVGNHQYKIDEKNSILAPQMLEDGRVLLSGSSLKGMLRSTLATLLHAPMERVAERHYTYRPNLGFGTKRETRAAVITRIEGEGGNAQITVNLLNAGSPVVFIRADAFGRLGKPQPGTHIHRQYHHVFLSDKAPRMRLDARENEAAKLDHYVFLYRGGMDGEGHFAQAFNNGRVYRHVLVLADCYAKSIKILIPNQVLHCYLMSQAVLADDISGHLSPGHPLSSKLNQGAQAAILENSRLQVNQLIYVEVEAGQAAPRIVSMGHHFQYRWGYTSSVRYKNRLLDGKGVLRPELGLHVLEQAGADGAPQQLTGARLLFGYTLEGQQGEQRTLASGNFKRFAGRIAFNTAIEAPGEKTMNERFMAGGDKIQLRILGMPRPSAVEFYLRQTTLHDNRLATYGDLPDDAGGELAGRKYYRHQPDAQQDSKLYMPDKSYANAAERGTCVRYLSRPGSCFHCTVRFDSLRPWELGALLVALNPKLIEPLFDTLQHSQDYAHKLGYGKPLGLGSVRLVMDGVRWQENDDNIWRKTREPETDSVWGNLKEACLVAFRDRLQSVWGVKAKNHLEAWLKARRWLDSGHASYPMATTINNRTKVATTTIFNFHSDLRRKHAAVRRGAERDFSALKKLLEST